MFSSALQEKKMFQLLEFNFSYAEQFLFSAELKMKKVL